MTWINAPIAKCYPMNLGGALPWCCALLLRRPAVRVGRSAWRSFAQRGTSCRSSATCCVRIEWWIGSTSIRLPIGGPSLRPSSQSALLSARCLGGLSHYYAGLDRSLRARPHRGREVLLPLPHGTDSAVLCPFGVDRGSANPTPRLAAGRGGRELPAHL